MAEKMSNSSTSSKNHLELTSVNAQNNSSYSHINNILTVLHETLSRSNQIQQKFLEHQAQVLQTINTRAGILTNSINMSFG